MTDRRVRSIGGFVAKKVGDRLKELHRDDPARYADFEQFVAESETFGTIAGIAEKIIASMEMPIQLPGNASVLTSLSIGIAVYPDNGEDADTLLKHSDTAMYHAKQAGRNQVLLAGEQPSPLSDAA